MGGAALRRNVNIQYCMSLSRHLLHPSPARRHADSSQRRLYAESGQWRIGVTNLLAHALGLKPFQGRVLCPRGRTPKLLQGLRPGTSRKHLAPLALTHRYGGRINVTASGKECLPWTDFGWDDKYYGSGMALNLCRNPEDLRDGPFCYTKAGFDIPEEEWEWEYCAAPVCDVDCYFGDGALYIGGHNVTQSGLSCVDWAGEFGLSGARCRNPDGDVAPWCFVAEDHSQRDYCDNECPEAVEYSPSCRAPSRPSPEAAWAWATRRRNLDVELIMKSCNKEGLLLHPTKPATVIDLYFTSPEYREVWTGYSTVGDHTFGFIFLAEVEKALTLSRLRPQPRRSLPHRRPPVAELPGGILAPAGHRGRRGRRPPAVWGLPQLLPLLHVACHQRGRQGPLSLRARGASGRPSRRRGFRASR
ncbi:putative plasminogen-like [Penaeus vannamei]|uniref:Putative plasminogen-like n=1 Tax=Penaeus vannamei TaxID=6689 RepID=A0A423TBX9_PENVA|nr:putative plasminogen-like [Penaeus vannamei]